MRFYSGNIRSSFHGALLTLAAACLLVLHAEPALAQVEDSLCIFFDSPERGLHLELDRGHLINGMMPLTICDLRPGERCRLEVGGGRFERRAGYLDISRSGDPSIKGNRISAFLRNSVLPGWGTVKTGRRWTGFSDVLNLGAYLYYLLMEETEYRDMKELHDDLIERLAATSDNEERAALAEEAHFSSRAVNVQNTHRKRILYAAGAIYGYQLIDPYISGRPPGWKREAGGSILEVHGSHTGRVKAFIHSALWPGRGQFYQGKNARGVIYSALAAAAGLYALDRHNAYDEYGFVYEVEIDRFNDAASEEDRVYHRDRAQAFWNELEEARKDRNTAYIILAGLWGISLIDTFFPSDEPASSFDLSLEISPDGGALVYRF